MSSAVFDTIRLLESARLHFFTERTRPTRSGYRSRWSVSELRSIFLKITIWRSAGFAAMRRLRVAKNFCYAC